SVAKRNKTAEDPNERALSEGTVLTLAQYQSLEKAAVDAIHPLIRYAPVVVERGESAPSSEWLQIENREMTTPPVRSWAWKNFNPALKVDPLTMRPVHQSKGLLPN